MQLPDLLLDRSSAQLATLSGWPRTQTFDRKAAR
jgi:hypothetical protein